MSIADVVVAARSGGRLALDTEFVGEQRYWALLCLVGLAADPPQAGAAVPVALVDPIDGEDPGELPDLLADPEIEIVVHAGRQDVAILKRAWDTPVTNIFDTQIAAAFAGYGAQLGYGRLVQAVLDERLPKGETFARWDQRPLKDQALQYARADVAHLPAVAASLRESLAESGRLDWTREECRKLEDVSDRRDPDEVYLKLPRVRQMRPAAIAVARELAAWRERTAASEDRAVRSVIGDQQLIELAQRKPTSRAGLREIRGLAPRTAERRGDGLLAAIAQGIEAPAVKLSEGRAPSPDDAPLISLSEAFIRSRAREAGLAYELLASRDEIASLVASVRRGEEPDARPVQGWRAAVVGADLCELLAGRRSLAVQDGRLQVTEC